MSTMDGLLGWNRTGSDRQIQNSEVGPDGSINVSNYGQGHAGWGNGFDSALSTHYVGFTAIQVKEQGCVTYTWIPALAYTAITGGVFLNPISGVTGSTCNRMSIDGTSAAGQITSISQVGSAFATSSGVVYSAGDEVFIAMVWDENGIDGGSDLIRTYVKTPTQALSFWGGTTGAIYNGSWDGDHRIGQSWIPATSAVGVVDNVKVYNFANILFINDIFNQGFGGQKRRVS